MATNFELIFKNNSDKSGDVCIFLQQPNENDLQSLVWLSKDANPNTTITFQWAVDYSVLWSEEETRNGVKITSSETLPANLENLNEITLTKKDGAYQFINQTTNKSAIGSIFIISDNTVEANQAIVGVNISGKGVFTVPANPNMTYQITPQNEYWIAFGSFTEGEILDTETFNKAAEISYPDNVYSMTAILNADDTWTSEPS